MHDLRQRYLENADIAVQWPLITNYKLRMTNINCKQSPHLQLLWLASVLIFVALCTQFFAWAHVRDTATAGSQWPSMVPWQNTDPQQGIGTRVPNQYNNMYANHSILTKTGNKALRKHDPKSEQFLDNADSKEVPSVAIQYLRLAVHVIVI